MQPPTPKLHHTARLTLTAVTLCGALSAAGCATGTSDTFGDGGNAHMGGGGGTETGGGGAAPGGGGSGGGGGLCPVDCTTIETPACYKSVCNDGMYPGVVGECVVVKDDDGTSCDDGEFCTTQDSCLDGVCTGGPANDCGMSPEPCQLVQCNESSQSCSQAPAPNGGSCTPADLCQIGGQCQNGLCVGQPKDCFFAPVPNECHKSECNPQNGQCEPVVDPTMNGQGCATGGDLCMENKTCDNGQCIGGTPKDCSQLTVGCTNGVCDPNTGTCIGQPVPPGGQCFDGIDQCHTGQCDNNQNCVPSAVPDGTSCDDYNSCTNGDLCTGGVCGGSPVSNCTTYFEEYFDVACPPPGWTLSGDWECGAPTVGPGSAYSSPSCLGTVLTADYNDGNTWTGTNAQTPPIDLSLATEPVLAARAWTQTEGFSYDGWNIKISTDGGTNFSVLSTVDPPYDLTVNGEPAWGADLSALGWQLIKADLSTYVGQQVIFRFSFRSDSSVTEPGVFVDDVIVAEAADIPLVITSTSPLADAYVSYAYSASLQKSGGSTSSVWSITGGTNIGWLSINPATGELTGTPTSNDAGPVSVDVHVQEPTAPGNFDDKTFAFNVTTASYFESFEGPCPNGWTLGGDWQCGTPTSVGPSAAYSGTQCLGTQLASDYNNGQSWTSATASSPAISLAGMTTPKAYLRLWISTEGSSYDGANLKLSTDGGASYQIVTGVQPPYNLTSVGGQAAWGEDQSASGWQLITADLTSWAGQSVNLQLGFRSDSSVTYPGVYLDDVVVAE